jgi:hypothetical protein
MTDVKFSSEVKCSLIASFLGVKFIPMPIVLGVNNFNPKLIFRDHEIECRACFTTKRTVYNEVESVDVFFARKTTNICIRWKNSVFTFIGNFNNKELLKEALLIMRAKDCPLSAAALLFIEKQMLSQNDMR